MPHLLQLILLDWLKIIQEKQNNLLNVSQIFISNSFSDTSMLKYVLITSSSLFICWAIALVTQI